MEAAFGPTAPERERAARLALYLRDLVNLRWLKVRDCQKYDEAVWLGDVPRLDRFTCGAWSDSGNRDVWLSARKEAEAPPPTPPDICAPWYDARVLGDSGKEPALREAWAPPEDQGGGFRHLRDEPRVQEAWLRYLIEVWQPWAARHQAWQGGQKIYDALLRIYRKQQRRAEEFELVLGVGLLSWQTPSEQRVSRHLVVARADLAFEPQTGEVSVQAHPEGAALRAEWDMLEPTEQPLPIPSKAIEEVLAKAANDPWDAAVLTALESCVHAIDGRGTFSEQLGRPSAAPGRVAVVTLAPALILRRREQRSMLRLLDGISERIGQGREVPEGFLRLCTTRSAPGRNEDSAGPRPGAPAPILFPLPTNDEQLRVAETLERGDAVLVQGPPGTGKTWTIANLLCHLLAQGKRVLVTSQTPRALNVLKGKLPEQIRPLCVSVLGDTKDLEDSVQGLVRKFHEWREDEAPARIARLEGELAAARSARYGATNRCRSVRERETWRHQLPGTPYEGTAEGIGRRLAAEAGRYGWIPDTVPEGEEPPIDEPELRRLVELARRLTPERVEALGRWRPAAGALLAPDDLAAAFARARALAADCEGDQDRLQTATARLVAQASAEARRRLREKARCLAEHLARFRGRGGWQAECLEAAVKGSAASWRALGQRSGELARELEPDAAWWDARRVSFPDGRDRATLRADLVCLREHLRNGGGWGWWFIRPEPVRRGRYIVRGTLWDGASPSDLARLDALERYLAAGERASAATALWARTAPIARSGLLAAILAELQERGAAMAEILDGTERLGEEYRSASAAIPGLGAGAADPQEIAAVLDAVERRQDLNNVRAELDGLAKRVSPPALTPAAHPCCARLHQAVQQRNIPAYAAAWREVGALDSEDALRRERDGLWERLAAAAPRLAAGIAATPADPAWDRRADQWKEAWAWARARNWLGKFCAEDPERLRAQVEELEANERKCTTELVTFMAWRQCFARIRTGQEDYLQFLQAWAKEIRLIGKGTGRWAGRHRQNAQSHLDRCRAAIPAWVIPFYRLADSVGPEPGVFDVAIVDEASQSGPEALILYYLAKQVLVVGDDQQISPDNVGRDQAEVHALLAKHLDDLDLRDTFGTGYSLFDNAAIRSAGRIILREHFRCMPEIIRFSSDLCYPQTPLLPLRRYASQRLEPLKTCHVAGGHREGRGPQATNRPEAEAVTDAVARCCADLAYAGRTMGVISLQGEAQAEVIDRLLRGRLDAKEIEERRLICGDAYAFQGTERDVIFLSLVAATNERFQAQTAENAKRRFNVAASRARDQCWLFHSVTLNDLNPDDLRHRLLSHYLHKTENPVAAVDWLQCGSDFERDVGREIVARGYRVIPQFEPFGPGGYRIDFVVDAGGNRLAVECDGDRWHGPERYEQDMFRQRQLERAGWRFWRVRASAFYLDQQAAMASLWQELDSEGDRACDEPAFAEPRPGRAEEASRLNLSAVDAFEDEPDGSVLITEVPAPRIRDVILELLGSGPLHRGELLRAASARLGYRRLGRLIRVRLSQQVGAQIRAGRIRPDGDTLVLV